MTIFSTIIKNLNSLFSNNEFLNYMVESTNNSTSHTTNVQVIHDDGSWSNGIRSLFIYGTGALRISMMKGYGTPASRAFVVAGAIGTEALAKLLNNTINDPDYIKAHASSWKTIWDGIGGRADIYVENDKETAKMVDELNKSISPSTNKFFPDGNSLEDLYNKFISQFMDILRPILEPIKVDYSNEILANQLNDISIILFMMSILIFFLILAFMVNTLIYINSDRIYNYFSNKYIKWYVNFNKKIIGIELMFLGSSILYFMYMLSYGLRFLATHPIFFT
jgi:hypothetical protein